MIRFIALFIVFGFITAAQADEGSLLTEGVGAVGRHIALVGENCSRIFLLDRQYALDEKRSSLAYTKKLEAAGAFEEVVPAIKLKLALKPASPTPTERDVAEILTWAKASYPDCAGREPAIERYPSLLARVAARTGTPVDGFNILSAALEADGTLAAQIEIEPLKVKSSLASGLLRAFAPELDVASIRLEPEVAASLEMSFAAAATFAQHHYTERVCFERRRCWKVLGVKVRCRTSHWCDDIPRVVQELKDLATTSAAKLEVLSRKDTPEAKVNAALEELMSRFIGSMFQENARRKVGEVVEITMGELKKTAAENYRDEIVHERAVNTTVRQPLDLGQALAGLEGKLAAVYAQGELACLIRETADGERVTTDHKCLQKEVRP